MEYFVVWIDLTNAFWRVRHNILIEILEKIGISNEILIIIKDAYLVGKLIYERAAVTSEISGRIALKRMPF